MQDNANKYHIEQKRDSPEKVLPLPRTATDAPSDPLIQVPPTDVTKPGGIEPPKPESKPAGIEPPRQESKPAGIEPPKVGTGPLVNVPPDLKSDPLTRSPSGLTPDQQERSRQFDRPATNDFEGFDNALIAIGIAAATVLAFALRGPMSSGSMQTSPGGVPLYRGQQRYDY